GGNLEFEYIDYKDDLLAEVIDNQEPCIYLFANYNDKQEAEKVYQKPLLKQRSLFLTLDELKEKLFVTDKLVLKEEKLVLMFYEVLTKADKEKLGIEDYFNVIELANDFFDFYDELNEYQIEEINALTSWQQEKYEVFQEIRDRFDSELAKKGYTDRTLANDFANFNLQFIAGFSQIVAVNILEVSPLEKEILAKLERAEKKIKFYYQLQSSDFDEQQLTLKSLTLPQNLDTKVEIYQSNNQFLELINLLVELKETEKNYELLDADRNNSQYNKLLSSEKFELEQDFKFSATKLYQFLEGLYNLLKSSDNTAGALKLDLAQLRELSCSSAFKEYYGLQQENINSLNQLAQRGYVYLNKDLIKSKKETEQLDAFLAIIDDILTITRFNNLPQFIEWLNNLELEALATDKFENDIAKYFSALAEIKAISDLEIISSWADYFVNPATGLFKLILRYLKFKKLNVNLSEENNKIALKQLLTASIKNRENIIILNSCEGMIPSVEGSNFLLTEQQRRDLGLISSTTKRLKEEYKFYREVLSAEKVIIFTLKNEEQNITPSSFLEKLILNYDLDVKKAAVKEKHYGLIMQQLFTDSQLEAVNSNLPQLKIPLDKTDFQSSLRLSYYKYRTLQTCYCKFYLQHLMYLQAEWEVIEKKLSKKTLGSLVHNIFEAVVSKMSREIKNKDFAVDKKQVRNIVEQEITKQKLKIPNYYESYYQEILFPVVTEAVVDFLKKLEQKLEGKIEELLIEYAPQPTRLMTANRGDVFLTGRIDLAVKTSQQNYIIDYKTGSGSEEQLDFYALLFDEKEQQLERNIYNVLEKRFNQTKIEPAVELKQELIKELEQFFEIDNYQLAANYHCNNCQYFDVCKVVLK
ncbi:MAG: PD-(D/E)XK nuclease family protein, partial [Bacillota bacterium]